VAAAAVVLAQSIHSFIRGLRIDSEDEVRSYVANELESARKIDSRFADFWDDVAPDLDYTKPATDVPYSLVNVEAGVNECIPTAVGVFLIFRHDLEEAVCAAARVGGATDTTATVVGALAGAYHGASKIPPRWLSGVCEKERLQAICKGLIDLWQ
ncbi:MAG: ADP-ribosylglycohydrolase family protein, partial [Cyanobacteria bacterium]|nr:ADP-ribosylglycohydrolase family protein [Cyanobacteriota bacterium]